MARGLLPTLCTVDYSRTLLVALESAYAAPGMMIAPHAIARDRIAGDDRDGAARDASTIATTPARARARRGTDTRTRTCTVE